MTTPQLCRVTCEDGLLLDGAFWQPESAALQADVDVFLLVHGTGGNFYSPGVLERFAERAAAAGIPVLRINTRGHDGLSHIAGMTKGKRGGAAYENVSECRIDLAAWADWLRRRGFQRIALVGHSMGGVKAIYALAQDVLPAVCCFIGISPPRFCFERLHAHPGFRDDFSRAAKLVDSGQGEALIFVEQPLSLLLTAAGFLEKYGPDDRYDALRWLPRLNCPVLMLLGSESLRNSPAFAGLDADLIELGRKLPNLRLEVIEGANTGYSGCLDVPFERVWQWLHDRDKHTD